MKRQLKSVTVPSDFKDKYDTGSVKSGKTYDIIFDDDEYFEIKSDLTGNRIMCMKNMPCAHIDNLKWILNYD